MEERIYGELNMQIVNETRIWIIKKLNLNSEDEIYCICGDYETYVSQMQNICDEDADYIFDNDCIISPRGIEYKGFCTKYLETSVLETSVSEIKHLRNCVKSANRDIVNAYENGKLDGYINAKIWHYVTDKLPPNPKESEDGKSILPLTYICAYSLNNEYNDYEIGEFMYLGDGVWNGENKNYPIYAWMDCAVEVPKPKKR